MSTTIATLGEFAYAIRRTSAEAAKHQLLLELAVGLVVDELGGEQDSYSVAAKAVVLEAAARAYWELLAAEQEGRPADRMAMERLVYLTDDQIDRLVGKVARGPQYSFPTEWPYPDPVEAPTDTVSYP